MELTRAPWLQIIKEIVAGFLVYDQTNSFCDLAGNACWRAVAAWQLEAQSVALAMA